jgi:hypothetical protein
VSADGAIAQTDWTDPSPIHDLADGIAARHPETATGTQVADIAYQRDTNHAAELYYKRLLDLTAAAAEAWSQATWPGQHYPAPVLACARVRVTRHQERRFFDLAGGWWYIAARRDWSAAWRN